MRVPQYVGRSPAAPGLRAGRGAREVGVGGEAPRAVLDRHRAAVHADRAREPRDADQRLQPHPDREPRVLGHEVLLDAELLAVVRPPSANASENNPPSYGRRRVTQAPAVGEVARRDLVHRDARQRRRAEHLEPVNVHLGHDGSAG